MSSTFPERVAFEDHRFMRAIDLEDEQLYHLQRRWQHNLALHSWGILCGLEVRVVDGSLQNTKVVIHPGMALDGYGRELVLTEVIPVLPSDKRFDRSITYDVWLSYNANPEDVPSMRGDDCFPEEGQCFAPEMNMRRIREQPQVILRPTSARQSARVTEPRDVPQGDLNYSPFRPMKFESSAVWPVFLCKLTCDGNKWLIDDSERHYGGIIAERIEVPLQMPVEKTTSNEGTPDNEIVSDRRTAILTGGHPDRKDWRFAVLDIPIPKPQDSSANKPVNNRRPQVLPDDVPAPLSIRAYANAPKDKDTKNQEKQLETYDTEIRWQAERVVAEADVLLRNGAGLQFEASPVGEVPIPPTSGWGMYRSFEPPTKLTGVTTNAQTGYFPCTNDSNTAQFADVLQISMPKTDAGLNSVAIGSVDAEGKFTPILEVNNDDSVDIFGMLRVHGNIYGVTSDLPPLDPNANINNVIERLELILPGSSSVKKQELVTKIADTIDSVTEFAPGVNNSAKQHALIEAFVTNGLNKDLIDDVEKGVVAAKVEKQKELYKRLADNIINLMPKDGGVGDVFARESLPAISTANASELRNFFVAIARHVIEAITNDAEGHTFAENFGKGVTSANNASEMIFYNALAKQIIDLMDSTQEGDSFATSFVAGIKQSSPGTQQNFYKKLAFQLVALTSDTQAKANAISGIMMGATPAANQKYFCLAMTLRSLELLTTKNLLTALASNANKWNLLLTQLWLDSTRMPELISNFPQDQTVPNFQANFDAIVVELNKLPQAIRTMLKNNISSN